jgi:nucleoside-diphosphate-sugar epimerase
VYGVNRDTGLTSDPTKAMKSAVLGRPFHIRFGGATDFQYVADTAATFIACAGNTPEGAHVFNLHGETVTVERIANVINTSTNSDLITFGGPPIPIAAAMDDSAIRRVMPTCLHTTRNRHARDDGPLCRLARCRPARHERLNVMSSSTSDWSFDLA